MPLSTAIPDTLFQEIVLVSLIKSHCRFICVPKNYHHIYSFPKFLVHLVVQIQEGNSVQICKGPLPPESRTHPPWTKIMVKMHIGQERVYMALWGQ